MLEGYRVLLYNLGTVIEDRSNKNTEVKKMNTVNIDAELEGLLAISASDAAAADALLADIDFDEVETVSAETTEEPQEILLTDKELGIDKTEIYESQSDTMGIASDEDAAPIIGSKQKAASKRAAKKSGEPTVKTDTTGMSRSGLLKLKADVSGLETLGYSTQEVEDIMLAIDTAPKKVGEKAYNLLRYGLGREHVSNFIRFTLGKLRSADDLSITVPELVNAMTSERSYSLGTARSQSQQMSRLFTIFGMVAKDGSKITLDPSHRLTSAILRRLDGEGGWAVDLQASADDEDGDEFVATTEVPDEEVTETPEVEASAPPMTTAQRALAKRERKAARKAAAELTPELIAA